MSDKAASNVIPMREFDRTSPDPQAAQFERLLKECQKLTLERLSQSVAAMLDKAEEGLWELANQTMDREVRDVYMSAKDKALSERKTIEDQFRQNYLAEFERRAKREIKVDEFSKYDLSSLELGLVNDEDLEETLKVNDMASKLRRYCEEELNALDQRIGVLIGDANLQADANPFSPQAVCNAYKQTCRHLDSNIKIRMIFHKLFDDHVLDDVRSIYKDLNALLIQRSILPKIRFGMRRGAGAIGRRPGATPAHAMAEAGGGDAGTAGGPMSAGFNPMAGMGMPMGMAMGMPGANAADAGYAGEGGGNEQDLFAVLQSLLARSINPAAMAGAMPGIPGGAAGGAAGGGMGFPGGVAGVPGGMPGGVAGGMVYAVPGAPMAGMPVGGVVQIPGFPPIMGGAVAGGGSLAYGGPLQAGAYPGAHPGMAGAIGVPMLPGTPGAAVFDGVPLMPDTGGTPLPQRFLQGAELIGSLTRLQHGDVSQLPIGMPGIDLSALASGKTNVVREFKSSGLGNQVDQTDGVTIDIVALLFDQIFGDKRVPEALKALIGRMQIPVVKVAVLDKKFFSKKSHPARRMLDTLGEFSLGLDDSFDQSSPLYKRIEAIIAQLLEQFVDDVDIFQTLQDELLEVIGEENKRAEISAKEMARKIAYKERLEVGKAIAQLEIKTRAQSRRVPQLVQKFLADEWMKLLLLTYARHGQDSEAWKSGLETMDHLIWSVTFKPSIEDRRKLANLLPGLLKRLQVGLQSTSSDDEKRKQFFTKLMRMHTKAMAGAAPKPVVTPGAVPTLSEEVVPNAGAKPTQDAIRKPAAGPRPPSDLATPPMRAVDLGREPAADPAAQVPAAKTQVAKHVVATPSIPVMTSATAVAPVTATPVEADDESEVGAASLEFSNVTIKNPFGDGDIEIEEISLGDLPGFGATERNDTTAGATDQYSQAVKKLKAGDWLEFSEGEQQRLQARLSYISPLKGTYLFVNREGESVGEYSLSQLAEKLQAARAVVLEDVPLIERAMSSLVGVLKKNTA